MEKLITILLKLSIILSFLLIAAEPSCAQKKGSFDEQLDHNGGKRTVSFLVPTGYTATKKWPVVIAFHPAQTPQTAMRQMMTGAATQLNVILACPDDLPRACNRIWRYLEMLGVEPCERGQITLHLLDQAMESTLAEGGHLTPAAMDAWAALSSASLGARLGNHTS